MSDDAVGRVILGLTGLVVAGVVVFLLWVVALRPVVVLEVGAAAILCALIVGVAYWLGGVIIRYGPTVKRRLEAWHEYLGGER